MTVVLLLYWTLAANGYARWEIISTEPTVEACQAKAEELGLEVRKVKCMEVKR